MRDRNIYDLNLLTREDVDFIIKKMPVAGFTGVVNYGISQKNKQSTKNDELPENIVELCDNTKNPLYDLWGEYDKNNNSLSVFAWDAACFWRVNVILFEDHFEIPKYRAGLRNYETISNFLNYKNVLSFIFQEKACSRNAQNNKEREI